MMIYLWKSGASSNADCVCVCVCVKMKIIKMMSLLLWFQLLNCEHMLLLFVWYDMNVSYFGLGLDFSYILDKLVQKNNR